jgi:hypothetical protein
MLTLGTSSHSPVGGDGRRHGASADSSRFADTSSLDGRLRLRRDIARRRSIIVGPARDGLVDRLEISSDRSSCDIQPGIGPSPRPPKEIMMKKPSMKKASTSAKGAARRAYDKVEAKVMAAVGRKTVQVKLSTAKKVGKKAAKAAAVAGAMAAAGVVLEEIRKKKGKRA